MALRFRKRVQDNTAAEMSFVDHLDVLRKHLVRCVLAIIVGAIVIAYYNNFFIKKVLMGPTHDEFPTYQLMCSFGKWAGLGDNMCSEGLAVKMQNTAVSGQFGMFFTVIIVGGIIIAFPFIFWQFWLFVKPALTKKELAKTRGVIFWVSLLFFMGVFFGYFVIAPYTVNFFANFQMDETIENIWTISSYIDTLVPLILGSGLAFQLPLALLFLARVGIVSATGLRSVRKYAVVVILIVAAIITPPDVISQIIVTIPLWILYEISILLTARAEKEKIREEETWS